MKYVSLLILAAILVFAYVQYDISKNKNARVAAEEAVLATEQVIKGETSVSNTSAGFIASVEGQAAARAANGGTRALHPSAQIFVGDTVSTEQGSAEITFDDGSSVSMQPNTQFKIQEFIYQANAEGNRSITELIKGQLRVISGKIGKRSQDRYELRTHVATIGIRGTHYAVRLCAAQTCRIQFEGKQEQLKDGLYLGVVEGAIVASSEAGQQEIKAGESFYQQNANTASVQIEPIADVLFEQTEIDTFMTIGVKRDSSRWIIHSNSEL